MFHFSEAQIINVPDDYSTIQQGIDAAGIGDTVLVADGIYYEQINFLGKKPLIVASHYLVTGDTNHINNTVIDGSQLTDIDNASVVYFTMGEDTTSILYGFTISGGKGTYVTSQSDRCGGGIFISGSGARIVHNLITGNFVDDTQPVNGEDAFGGGIGTVNEDGDYWVVIENNRIINNMTVSQYEWSAGGGIFMSYHSRIAGNYIINNISQTEGSGWAVGGGIAHLGSGATNTLIIHNNKINYNTASANNVGMGSDGAVATTFSHMIFTDNEVTGNLGETPGAMGGIGAMSIIDPAEGCVVSGNIFNRNIGTNAAGAILLENFYGSGLNQVLISCNYFLNNEAEKGGAVYVYNIPVILENNVFTCNYAVNYGGAIFLHKSVTGIYSHQAIFINNSFSENISGNFAGAIYSLKSKPLMINTVFYNDSASTVTGEEIYLNNIADTLTMAYCNIDQEKIFGNIYSISGNISEDPGFIDDSCHIDQSSPCYDAGADSIEFQGTWYYAPDCDFEGSLRPFGEGIDIGADEWDGDNTDEFKIQNSKFKIHNYPNPTRGIVDFQFSTFNFRWVSLKIYDIHGREVAVVLDKKLPAGEHTVRFDVSGLPNGMYFLNLSAEDKNITQKLIIHH